MSSPYAPDDSPSDEDEKLSPTLARYALMARMSANGRPTDSDMGSLNAIDPDEPPLASVHTHAREDSAGREVYGPPQSPYVPITSSS